MIIEKICSYRTESRRDDIFHPFGVMNIARPGFYNHHTPSGLLKFNCVTPIFIRIRIKNILLFIRIFAIIERFLLSGIA